MGKQAGLRFGGHVSDSVDSGLVVGGELEMEWSSQLTGQWHG